MVWRFWWRHQYENTFLGLFAYDRSISNVKLRLPLEIFKILKFSKVTKFLKVLANFFVRCVNGNWVCYIDIQVHYLHFELSVDDVAQILTALWQFQNLTYFLTSWPNYLTLDLHNKWVSSPYQYTCMGQVWWWLVNRCDLYPANNVPDRQTDKQMKKQSEIAYLPNFQIDDK